jgi:hypothetical protein
MQFFSRVNLVAIEKRQVSLASTKNGLEEIKRYY